MLAVSQNPDNKTLSAALLPYIDLIATPREGQLVAVTKEKENSSWEFFVQLATRNFRRIVRNFIEQWQFDRVDIYVEDTSLRINSSAVRLFGVRTWRVPKLVGGSYKKYENLL